MSINVRIENGATTNVRMGERLIVQNENVLEFPTITDFPATGAGNTLYIAEDEGRLYYWNGTAYVLVSGGGGGGSAEWGAIAGTLSNQTDLQNALNLKTNDADLATVAKTGDYNDLANTPNLTGFLEAGDNVSELVNDAGYITSAPVDSVNGQTGVVTIDKADVGLGNVDNTSDLGKPISTATQSALDNKVDTEVGKGLSDENYTLTEKTKLAGVAENANNYVHPNHSGEVTSTGDGATVVQPSAINNKPSHTVSGTEEVLINDSGTLRKTTAQDIANSGGGAEWGTISGTLSDQTDLQNALDLKADNLDLTTHVSNISNPHSTSDANIIVNDITTNNATALKHGFLPKLSASPTQYLNGQGNWASISGGSGLPPGYTEVAFTGQVSVTVQHDFGTKPLVQVLDDLDNIFIPLGVEHQDNNTVIVTFDVATSGLIIVTAGVETPQIITVNSDYTITNDDNIIVVTQPLSTITLPTAVGILGKKFIIDNASSDAIFLTGTGGETIWDEVIQELPINSSVTLYSTNLNYRII